MPFEVHFGCWGISGDGFGSHLEGLGICWAWAGSRTGPGATQWARLHSRPGGSMVLPRTRDPKSMPSGGWI